MIFSPIDKNHAQFLFRRHGINHLIDASVVLDDYGKVRSVIDFAVKEYELVYDEP
jgi:hypothetical protein